MPSGVYVRQLLADNREIPKYVSYKAPDEIWHDVVGAEPRYAVSNYGRLFAKHRKMLLHPNVDHRGYLRIKVMDGAGKYKQGLVATLVAAAFIGPKPYGFTVNHKDGVKANNHIDNLEYLTNEDNMRHAFAIGLYSHLVGEKARRARLTQRQADAILMRYAAGETAALLATFYKVNKTTIYNVLSGRFYA